MHADNGPEPGSSAADEAKDLLALAAAEQLLDEREQQARLDGATARQLSGLADERDELSRQRDELAARYDRRAGDRDDTSLSRDVAGASRDVQARDREGDLDVAFPDRYLSAVDRDAAAGDRADSHDDRQRSGLDRERSHGDRDRAAQDRADALANADRLEQELATLQDALESRNTIGQAQGLLMERYGTDADRAFDMLVRLSQETHIKVRDVAARLVEDATRKPGSG